MYFSSIVHTLIIIYHFRHLMSIKMTRSGAEIRYAAMVPTVEKTFFGSLYCCQHLMSTKMISGPIWQMSLKGITISGSQFRNPRNLLLPGTMIFLMQPVHWSNSRSETFPSFLQSFVLITSLHFNSENSMPCLFFCRCFQYMSQRGILEGRFYADR